ncbi:MAG: acyl-CoA dehydrogenase [Planctomycetota bacterium]|nr:MAG: acyl-CoA dehydrogenase [Planctomycetota bacterium]REJ93669.1 MAG: acyl-CoA dehydrogenase [Planctomycetota bacterium]
MSTIEQEQQEKQIAEAEELLGDKLAEVGFAKALYFGRYVEEALPPYPDVTGDEEAEQMVAQLQAFCRESVDPEAIDRNARIGDDVIRGLGNLGVLGACMPRSCGGKGMSQVSYCRLIEVLGGHCGSTALFVNAHHSIGPRSLVLFGTQEQQDRWLPKLTTGEWISAFALTEPEAGSDAGNVQTQATPTEDGSGYVLNGQKRWITNGGIAQVLTVMARTPVEGSDETKVTAFIVTPDMPGFEVVEERMEKVGVRGTATARLAFHDMFVPSENILGKKGAGLKVALTVLDFGRTTFGASCTGAAKFLVERATEHCRERVQFQKTLGEFELVKKKIAYMHAGVYAMESATYQTAALIDAGEGDYMIETAVLKVFATEVLWNILNDTIQLYGGRAYFTDEPYERMLRDARINTIGEGANDVLRAFVALVGMRDVGLELKGVLDAILSPMGNFHKIREFAGRKLTSLVASPTPPVQHAELQEDAMLLGRLIGAFADDVERLLRKYRESVLDRQYHQERIADSLTELYVSVCVLRRFDRLLSDPATTPEQRSEELELGRHYLRTAARRIRRNQAALWDNDDDATTTLANRKLRIAD